MILNFVVPQKPQTFVKVKPHSKFGDQMGLKGQISNN
jgi:hypothetical protein